MPRGGPSVVATDHNRPPIPWPVHNTLHSITNTMCIAGRSAQCPLSEPAKWLVNVLAQCFPKRETRSPWGPCNFLPGATENASDLINSMNLSPSWESTSYSATQEFLNILRNPKAHYRVHDSPPLVPILGKINPAHITPSYFPKIHLVTFYVPNLMSVSLTEAVPKNPSKSEALCNIS
jgi:hypothetical protein